MCKILPTCNLVFLAEDFITWISFIVECRCTVWLWYTAVSRRLFNVSVLKARTQYSM